MATVDERKAFRNTLIQNGFTRVNFSPDTGDGKYTERFTNGDNTVVIHWGPRTPDQQEFFPERDGAGSCRLCHVPHGQRHTCKHAPKFVGEVVNPHYAGGFR